MVAAAVAAEPVKEVVLALNATVEGQTTVHYIMERLKGLGIGLTVVDEALDKLAEEGFDPVYGARPLRRKIQSALEDQVAEKMLDGTLKDGDTARATLENDKIVVDKP